jgi:ribosome-binding factor A
MRIKYLPELTFELDAGAETAERVEQLIRQIHEEDEDR